MVKPYKRFESQGHLEMAYRSNKCNAYCLLSCWFVVFADTVTLHQSQGHRKEHEHICYA